ncbi:methyl-accepting chemotaxis protein [Cellulomonas soli]|uniref:Chemotaxis protein n=1 Tax=Cellulomonas soli TaxID=931535 RepID=A0A512PIJ4_9CELL|nr:methyl-accepting chemotaxis protein [Cellulomonas soli]NYI57461.1 methyl-accepting chemotaxis protein [Cellulomonas soli]GEP71025.1 chemotaxis protein [Cellulomonas soli]
MKLVPAVARPHRPRVGVRGRILGAVVVGSLASVGIGVAGLVALQSANTATEDIYSEHLIGVESVATIRRLTVEMRGAVSSHALASDADDFRRYATLVVDLDGQIDDAVAEYEAGAQGEQLTAAQDYATALEEYRTLRDDTLMPAAERGDLDVWRTLRDGKVTAPTVQMNTALTTLVELEKGAAKDAIASAQSDATTSRLLVIALVVVGLAAGAGLGVAAARSVIGPLRRIRAVCDGLADGDLTVEAGLTSTDEVGRIGAAIDTAVERLRTMVGTIDGSAQALAGGAARLSQTAEHIAQQAVDAQTQSGALADAAEQVSRSTQGVAASTEEMEASIAEIARNAAEAARVAGEAVAAATGANETVAQLGESSRAIGEVARTIAKIAEQTNLLALNATIEAARAGEAGKGFGVVAAEVKELARATAAATEDVSHRVELIQRDTEIAVGAIAGIGEVIDSIHEFQSTIASSVEEQTATASTMTHGIGDAATGTAQIADGIETVAAAATATRDGAAQSREAVAGLVDLAEELRGLVSQFRFRLDVEPGIRETASALGR